MGHGMTKAERLREIERLYTLKPLSDNELAQRLRVERSTIFRDRQELSLELPIFEFEPGRYFIDRTRYLSGIKVDLHEALALYLAARRAFRQTRIAQPHVASALEKLAIALKQPMTSRLVRAAGQVLQQDAHPERVKTLEEVTRAWAEQRKLEINYLALHSDQLRLHLVHPYLIEPSLWSDGTYLVGHNETYNSLATFKIERIESAYAHLERFELPPDFDDEQILQHAWGIWTQDHPPVNVRMRFFPGEAARRLKESIWHRTQQIIELPDGGCEWSAQISEWQEMIPWVRGWGADVEVLEPVELRRRMEREVEELAAIYQLNSRELGLLAHFRKKDRIEQSLQEHLENTALIAGKLAAKVNLHDAGKILGWLHDLGKGSIEFQNYIRSANELIDPDADSYVDVENKRGEIDHSSAGAQLVFEKLINQNQEGKIAAQILSLCLASHHSGLIDCISPDGQDVFTKRINKSLEKTHKEEALSRLDQETRQIIADLFKEQLAGQIVDKIKGLKEEKDSINTFQFKISLLIRFLFSCLLDADRLDTSDFENPRNVNIRQYGHYVDWQILIERLDGKISEFKSKINKNHVHLIRELVSKACLDFSTKPKGIYQLTVPTGGGKTLASLRFALHHAQTHQLEHIFYIIPYTSIIDQNADEIRKILEDKDETGNYVDRIVLEHHSNLTPEEESMRQNLLAQNWDAPIVFTTQVQFFEALFGSGTRGARRMHQLANSVIIMDEVQTVPIYCIEMLNTAIHFLLKGCNSSIILCTATQPPLDKIEAEHRRLLLTSEYHIIPDEANLYEALKRVTVLDQRKPEGWEVEETTKQAGNDLEAHGSVLIVVNTKKAARDIYQSLVSSNVQPVFHLSTNMCAAHRLDVLTEIREKLKQIPLICVSTQLIEAGVDIDFDVVIRYLAGLDSIAQAAGRCNRHGLRDKGIVRVINPSKQNLEQLPDIHIGSEISERVLSEYARNPELFDYDLIGLKSMANYYKYYYYARKNEMKYPVGKNSLIGREDDLYNLLSMNSVSVSEYERINGSAPRISFKQAFQSAARMFQVVGSPTAGVVAPYGETGEEIIAKLCCAYDLGREKKLIRKAQRYSVNLFPHEFRALADQEVIKEVQKGTGIFYLDKTHYHDKMGWTLETDSSMENLIF